MNQTEFEGLPLQQRKDAQQRLIDQGLYVGKPDGRWGGGTEAAFKAEDRQRAEREDADRAALAQKRKDDLEAKRLRLEGERLKQQGEAGGANRAAREAREAEANSPVGVARNIAAFTAAPIGGYLLGRKAGEKLNLTADQSQIAKNASLEAGAQGRLQGLTTREGARIGAERSGAMPLANPLLRVGGRSLPHMIGGAGMLGKGAVVYALDDPENSPLIRDINHGVAAGFVGTGVGMLEKGAGHAIAPRVSPSARDIAVIESNQLRRGPLQAQSAPVVDVEAMPVAHPPKALPAPRGAPEGPLRHSVRLANAATAAGAKPGKSKGSTYTAIAKGLDDSNIADVARALDLPETVGKAGILQRARELARTGGKSAILAPLAAAGAAYGMTDTAEAADGSSGGSPATAAAIAGGTALGVNRLLQAIPRGGGAMFGEAMAPTAVEAMTDYSPDEMATAANWQMRNMPEWTMSPSVKQTYQMAQVPEASPYRNDQFDAQLSELNALLGEAP